MKTVTAKGIKVSDELKSCITEADGAKEISECIDRFDNDDNDEDVKIYSSDGCEPCIDLKNRINNGKVDLVDIDKNEKEKLVLEEKAGGVMIPTIEVDGDIVKIGTKKSVELP